MKTNVIRIGKSHGILIPKALLKQCQIEDAVELEVQSRHLVIRSQSKARAGWKQEFEKMASRKETQLFNSCLSASSDWDRKNWTW